jgi:DNA repair protein RadC
MNMNMIKTEQPAAYSAANVLRKEELVISRALKILESRLIIKSSFFTSPLDTKNYLKCKLAGLDHEEFHCLFLDSQHGLIRHECLFTGTIDGASVYPREVIKKALQYNAAALIFSHNHPSGNYEPSHADLIITKKLKDCASMFDIRVLDHIIIGGVNAYSLADHGQI